MAKTTLFDPSVTQDRTCLVCGQVSHAGGEPVADCQYDHDYRYGLVKVATRPKDCLNQYDPDTAPIPY